MKTDGCKEWRQALGAHVLGQLSEDEQAAMRAHLDGCPACRAELAELQPVARAMPLADPGRFADPVMPPSELGGRIVSAIAGERRSSRRRRRRRVGFAFATATATAAVAFASVAILLSAGGVGPEQRRVSFSSLPAGMEIAATLMPRSYGTEIRMYVEGVPSGALCRVFLRTADGSSMSAGTFRYRYGEDDAVLSSGLDLSRARTIVLRIGRRAYTAPVDAAKPA